MAKPQRLPGMENGEIEALQIAAIEYADIRDERQRLTTQEVELKMKLLRLMKEYKKSNYEYGGVEIELVTVEETVKVKVHKPDDKDEPERPRDAADALCRLCQAPNPSFITHDGKFFYCEKDAANKQEGEVLTRIRDPKAAAAITEEMQREPGDESENEAPKGKDPLESEMDFNARNRQGRRKKAAK